jgi:hypothetical protein
MEVFATILFLAFALMFLGSVPVWNHSKSWGYYPSGGLGVVAVIVIILMATGRI